MSNQSPDMLNMTYEGGAPAKRYGYDRVNSTSWGNLPIRGMFEFRKVDGTTEFLVAWGGKIWRYDESTDTKTDLMTGTKTAIEDATTTFFQLNDKVFISTPSDYCVYDGVNPIQDVTDIAYIPTISLSRTPDGVGTVNEQLNYLSNYWKDSFNGDGTSTAYHLSFDGLSTEPVKAWVDGVEKFEDTDFTVDRANGIVNFNSAPPEGVNNVVIQAHKDNLMDATKITKCTIHEIYGGKTDTRIFFAGHPELKNWRFHSALFDPTYFPEENYVLIGSDAEAITGFGKMIDYLIIYKERREYYTTIETDSEGKVIFPVYPLNDEYGCIASRTVQPAQGGLLALSEDGVTFTLPSLVRGQLNVRVVSQNINGRNSIAEGLLDNTKEDLRNAHAYIYDDKYWLHVKDKVWILDLKFTNLHDVERCWYPYDGVPGLASCFLEKDNEFYIGSNANGLIFKEMRNDIDKQYLDDGAPIDAYWTSPLLFLGGRDWVKKFERITMTLKPEYCTSHTLTFITNIEEEDVPIIQEAGIFSYAIFSYACFSYGASNRKFPSSQAEKIGYKGEYFQFRIRNNAPKRGLTILSISIQFSLRKRVK